MRDEMERNQNKQQHTDDATTAKQKFEERRRSQKLLYEEVKRRDEEIYRLHQQEYEERQRRQDDIDRLQQEEDEKQQMEWQRQFNALQEMQKRIEQREAEIQKREHEAKEQQLKLQERKKQAEAIGLKLQKREDKVSQGQSALEDEQTRLADERARQAALIRQSMNADREAHYNGSLMLKRVEREEIEEAYEESRARRIKEQRRLDMIFRHSLERKAEDARIYDEETLACIAHVDD